MSQVMFSGEPEKIDMGKELREMYEKRLVELEVEIGNQYCLWHRLKNLAEHVLERDEIKNKLKRMS